MPFIFLNGFNVIDDSTTGTGAVFHYHPCPARDFESVTRPLQQGSGATQGRLSAGPHRQISDALRWMCLLGVGAGRLTRTEDHHRKRALRVMFDSAEDAPPVYTLRCARQAGRGTGDRLEKPKARPTRAPGKKRLLRFAVAVNDGREVFPALPALAHGLIQLLRHGTENHRLVGLACRLGGQAQVLEHQLCTKAAGVAP